MPKNTLHGGPTNKADYPPSFGAALAAARAGGDVSVTAGSTAPEFSVEASVVLDDGTPIPLVLGQCPVCGVDYTGMSSDLAVVEGEPDEGFATFTANGQTTRYEPCGHETTSGGDGEPSTAGDLVTAEGGKGGGARASLSAAAVEITAGPEGGEQPSPGNSSSTSEKKPRKNAAAPKPPSQPRAPRTGSRSKKPADSSTADSADESATNSSTDNN